MASDGGEDGNRSLVDAALIASMMPSMMPSTSRLKLNLGSEAAVPIVCGSGRLVQATTYPLSSSTTSSLAFFLGVIT